MTQQIALTRCPLLRRVRTMRSHTTHSPRLSPTASRRTAHEGHRDATRTKTLVAHREVAAAPRARRLRWRAAHEDCGGAQRPWRRTAHEDCGGAQRPWRRTAHEAAVAHARKGPPHARKRRRLARTQKDITAHARKRHHRARAQTTSPRTRANDI